MTICGSFGVCQLQTAALPCLLRCAALTTDGALAHSVPQADLETTASAPPVPLPPSAAVTSRSERQPATTSDASPNACACGSMRCWLLARVAGQDARVRRSNRSVKSGSVP